MTRTTPPRPDVAAAVPELAAYARTATRLHPRPGAPGVGDSSVGGPLLWPAEEPWPVCTADHATAHRGKTYQELLIRQALRKPLPVDLPSRAREVTRRVDDIHKAMRETAMLAAELEEAIQTQRRALEDYEQEAAKVQRAAKAGAEATESILQRWDVCQRPQRRRSFWGGLAVNVIVGFTFYALGVLTPVLVTTDPLRNLLHR